MTQKVKVSSKGTKKPVWSAQDIVHQETPKKTKKSTVSQSSSPAPVKKAAVPQDVKKAVTVVQKDDIVRKVAKSERFPQKHVKIILDEALYHIQQSLKKGHDVSFMEFGRFKVKKVPGGFVQHIQTKQRLAYGPSLSIGFRPSRVLKTKITSGKKAA